MHEHVVMSVVPEVEDYCVAVIYYAAQTEDLADVVGLLEIGD